jgi:heterodisulfide reductase subunit A-like polyferredoxin
MPACQPKQDKRVAIVGAGPAGLAAAYYLLRNGYACTVFDERERPGGMLRYGVPQDVLDAEIELIEKLGADFRMQTRIGTAISMEDLQKDFDAAFIATGELKAADTDWLGIDTKQETIVTKGRTYQTSLAGVFAGGDAVRKRRLTVRAVADGKEAAAAISQYLSGQEVTGKPRPFNTHIGRLRDGEMEIFLASASRSARLQPESRGGGFSDEQARDEAARCLHCDCRKPKSCKLRKYSHQHQARPRRYKSELPLFTQQLQHPDVIYESGKCIRCGLCIQITAEAKEQLGLTFIGRGFDARVAVPFDHTIAEGLKQTARKCVQACPTGALAFKQEPPGA